RFCGSFRIPHPPPQHGKTPRQPHLAPPRLDSTHALSDLSDSLFFPPLLYYRPASHDQREPPPKRNSPFSRKSNYCVIAPLCELRLAAEEMHDGGMKERNDETKGVSKIVGQRERFVGLRQRAIRITKQPQGDC